jgi:hypothetical protein
MSVVKQAVHNTSHGVIGSLDFSCVVSRSLSFHSQVKLLILFLNCEHVSDLVRVPCYRQW